MKKILTITALTICSGVKNGKYTAPETPGIYHITASSKAYPKVQASTFVVVRERVSEADGS